MKRWITLVLVLVVSALSYVDRQVFTLFQDDIKVELQLGDGQLGLLSGLAFALFYALAAFPVARYADRGDRRLVIAVSVTVWSVATAACGVAASFLQMLLARIGLAAGEAGAGPAGNALLTEIFPPHRRTLVIGSILAASSAGISGGAMLAGYLARWFDWREIFLIFGLPGILIGLFVWLFVSEPRRSPVAAGTVPTQETLSTVVGIVAKSASLRWISLVTLTAPVAGFGYIIWGASFFRRVHGMSAEQTGFWFGGAMGIGLILSSLLSGFIGDRLSARDARFNSWLACAGLLAAFPFAMLFCFTSNARIALGSFVAVKFLMALHLPPIIALAFSQVRSTMRAMMTAVINMFIAIAGTGIGGTLAGYLSQAFASYGNDSLRYALAMTSCGLLIAGFAARMAGRTARPLAAD